MTALATDQALLGDSYDVVIVGSGYGGAITAARLGIANHAAGSHLRIALLERGVEHPVGSGPQSTEALVKQLRTSSNPLGLYEIVPGETIDVIQGCGLGGTSLNDMNAAVVPDREVFLESWPEAFRDEVLRSEDGVGDLDTYFDRARLMLGSNPWREGQRLAKASVFDAIAARAGVAGEAVHVNVNGRERLTRYGVRRGACTNCGDCSMVCNIGAKNTLASNYLPMSRRFGVALFERIEVDHVARAADGDAGYRVHCRLRTGALGRRTTKRVITARHVVLSAGSLGTTAILLRSAAHGLRLSERLGEGFSGNGDGFAVAYNTDRVTDAQGFGTSVGPRAQLKAGPSITSMMRFGADQPDLRKRFTVQDLTAPRALVDVMRLGLMAVVAATEPDGRLGSLERWSKDVEWNTDGAMNHSLGLLIMAHDSSDGRIVLDRSGAPRIEWPDAPLEGIHSEVHDVLREAVEQIGGTLLVNPRWSSPWPGNNVVTAHPLGGCATADSPEHGVVDHAGRVFEPGGGVHDGLYAIDGSVIPRALAVSPLLTISMFAERAAVQLRSELRLGAYRALAEGDDRLALADEPPLVGRPVGPPPTRPRRARPPRPRRRPATPGPAPAPVEMGPVAARITALRDLALADPARAQDDLWQWMRELGAERDGDVLAQLFALGTVPNGLDGVADGILVTTLINPLVDVPLRLLTSVWTPWRGKTFDAASRTQTDRLAAVARLTAKLLWPLGRTLSDELVELVPDTHLGRVSFRAPGVGEAQLGYVALRQPAAADR